LQVLNPKIPVRRMVFNEITRDAIQNALHNTRELDLDLVDAQETRRILDRLYGYEVSPVLWKKVMPRLSAGRVQSVALRLVVDRERERMAFVRAGYADIEALLDPGSFTATLTHVDGVRVARGDSFDDRGQLKKSDVRHLDLPAAEALVAGLSDARMTVESVEEKPGTRRPSPPFMTSTLQQEASRKLRWGGQRTMRVAQGLYERGFITYMRTDSTNLSETAINAARDQARSLYGDDHVFPGPKRDYTRKVKNAQEAHEAIRPAGDSFRTPGQVTSQLNPDELALYDLIWKRTVASQMADARGTSMCRCGSPATPRTAGDVDLLLQRPTITFPGFLRPTSRAPTIPAAARRPPSASCRTCAEGQALPSDALEAEGPRDPAAGPLHRGVARQARSRSSASAGRRPTRRSSDHQDRGYVWKKGSALVPSWVAFAVVSCSSSTSRDLVDYAFTARMEDDLDAIAQAAGQRVPWLDRFWFGERGPAKLETLPRATGRQRQTRSPGPQAPRRPRQGEIDPAEINVVAGSSPRGEEIVVKPGKFGPYLKKGDETEVDHPCRTTSRPTSIPLDLARSS
jgi:DNA topoisomerase-1